MKNMIQFNKHLLIAATTLSVLTVSAREKQGSVLKTSNVHKVASGCTAPQSAAELAVNNVRTIIFSGSDMWWDLFGNGNAYYVVPKVEDKSKWISSNFSGNVWFGGLDAGGQLKVAAQTYRQDGIDFWTGPLSTIDASVTQDICSQYDKIFKITRSEVDNFVLSGGPITSNIKNWPGDGDLSANQDPLLAPYYDFDGSGTYNPEAGDYPYYDVYNNAGKDNLGVCKARVFGDETLWWVYNDNGNVHAATGGKAIGMEVRAQAFAFKTTDEINNMTFYSYQIINRSSFQLSNTYMTVWTDADLGYYGDDYIGCDVKRGLGYIYNSDNYDETQGGVLGYGSSIPALGCDFFQGPINTTDGIDNNGNGSIDEPGEQMGMTKFLYFNNNFAGVPLQTTDPQNATQTYQYMTGFWRDGTPFTCGGNAYGGMVPTSFVYPADTYTNGSCGGSNWSEVTAANTPGDRRFLQSSGPFDLLPGAVNYITFGLPWARTSSTDQLASIPLLKTADDKAQALFDNCFKVLSGPEAPDMTIQELDNELILYFTNKPASNNYLNNYKELDVSIIVDTTTVISGTTTPIQYQFRNIDRYYHFEGFKVYQLLNEGITQEQLTDPSKAKLAFSCDVANGVKTLINYEFDAAAGGDVATVKTVGSDNGIKSTFHFTQDLFSSASNKKVINNKTYYFLTVAYGYNEYAKYKEDQPLTPITNPPSSFGQKRPYLEGRKSKKAYGIPHTPSVENNGTVAQSAYGYGPKITRIEGQGNGGNSLDFTESTINSILNSNGRVDQVTYDNARGPINVTVVDPLNIPNADFAVSFINKSQSSNPCFYDNKISYKNTYFGGLIGDSATWVLKNITPGQEKEYVPCKSIKVGEEFYFSELGLSVNIGQVADIAAISSPTLTTDKTVKPGDFIEGSLSFSDATQNWLTGVADVDGAGGKDWIRSGGFKNTPVGPKDDYQTSAGVFVDPNQIFEGVLGGTWAPYALTAVTNASNAAAPGASQSNANGLITRYHDLRALASVDIVFTSDKSKWTRCLVLEECDDVTINPNSGKKLEPKRKYSVDKQGVPWNAGGNYNEAVGGVNGTDTFHYSCSWFPGYAINLETGERLNIAFGEDSYQTANNGNDMMWNPTAISTFGPAYPSAFGGRHYIYVFGHNRSDTRYAGTTAIGGKDINGLLIGTGNYNANNFKELAASYKWAYQTNNLNALKNFWSEAMWVNIPLLTDARFAFSNPSNMPSDAKVRLRVKKPYRTRLSGISKSNIGARLSTVSDCELFNTSATTTASAQVSLSTDSVATPINNNMPYYTFSTSDIFSKINNDSTAKSALDLINVVPNPYYGYSTYEQNRLDNRVRITNLPNKCKIKIFTLNGTLVRTFDRDVSGQEDLYLTSSEFVHSKRLSFQDWDLKNQSGISVASGLYIIHVDVPGVGEKVVKWFGVMRPLDLQNY
jgi:hypothetical protein